MHVCECACVCVRARACVRACVFSCVCMRVHVCVHVSVSCARKVGKHAPRTFARKSYENNIEWGLPTCTRTFIPQARPTSHPTCDRECIMTESIRNTSIANRARPECLQLHVHTWGSPDVATNVCQNRTRERLPRNPRPFIFFQMLFWVSFVYLSGWEGPPVPGERRG